jgi:hypothetical protein
MCLLDYDYGSALGSALGSNRVFPPSESAVHSALVRGNSPKNSLVPRTVAMLDSEHLILTVADPTAANAMRDGWLIFPPPLRGRHPGEEHDDLEGDEPDEADDLDDDEFDDEDEEFDDEDFDDDDEEDIDEELDDEIDDIDIEDDEDDEDLEDDEDIDDLEEEDEDEIDDI